MSYGQRHRLGQPCTLTIVELNMYRSFFSCDMRGSFCHASGTRSIITWVRER